MVGPAAIVMAASLALCSLGHRLLASFSFALWVLLFVSVSMFYPSAFGKWFGVDLKVLIVPLVQIIMFGMGTTLRLQDFGRLFAMPWPVFIGIVLQFSVMPMAGYLLATSFGFEPAIAAGVVLIGSCPGGVASNLMTYLARGNVALSVTMTACSTLLAPVMTPLLMRSLAGQMVEINLLEWMVKIVNLIIVPILAGLIANRILYSDRKVFRRAAPLALIAAANLAVAVVAGTATQGALKSGIIAGASMIGLVTLVKLVVEVLLKGPKNWMDWALPILSMAGICYIIAIITARSREDLLAIGAALFAVSIVHNFIGYSLGYFGAKLFRLDVSVCRTVAFEVGMQNGGMATALATNALQSTQAALAPAIFGPWMNISGSVLASWWHRRPVDDSEPTANPDDSSECLAEPSEDYQHTGR